MQEGMSWVAGSFSCLPGFLIQDLMAPASFRECISA
jgi:hypothetical protein